MKRLEALESSRRLWNQLSRRQAQFLNSPLGLDEMQREHCHSNTAIDALFTTLQLRAGILFNLGGKSSICSSSVSFVRIEIL